MPIAPAPLLEQVLCPLCDPWVEHAGLIAGVAIAAFFAGAWLALLVAMFVRAASEARAADAPERREPSPPVDRARVDFELSADTEPARPLVRRHPAADRWDAIDSQNDLTVVRPPLEKPAPRGRRNS